MDKITFKDYPDTTTPVSADNLNQVQTNVENAINGVSATVPEVVNEETTSTTKVYCTSYINNEINTLNNKIDDLQYCVATITSAQTISSNYKVNLNSIDRSSGNFSLSNGGIVIGEGINTIRVSGSIFIDGWAGGSNYLWGQIKKNNTMISTSISGSTSSYLSATMSSTIISVEQGDFITLIADAGAGGSLRSGSANTFLCVEKIN